MFAKIDLGYHAHAHAMLGLVSLLNKFRNEAAK